METIKVTTNRKLENFLYSIGIKPLTYRVLWDGMVEWAYQDDEAFRSACDLYRQTKMRLYHEQRAV